MKEVRNLLQVVPPSEAKAVEASDEAIEKSVEAALAKEPVLKGSAIGVQSVNKGTVLLAGKAKNPAAQLRAIETAQSVRGVRAVRSEIESRDAKADARIWRELSATRDATRDKTAVESKGAKAAPVGGRDAEMRGQIQKALDTRKELRRADITVDVKNGVARLTGTVPSEAEKKAAVTIAKRTDGVRSVENQLKVSAE